MLDPLRQRLILQCGQGADRLAGALAVIGHVVAAQYCEGRDACRATATQGFKDNAGGRARRLWMRDVMGNRRIFAAQLPGGRAQAVTLFCDSERDDARLRRGHALQQMLQLLTALAHIQSLAQHPDFTQRHLLTVAVLGHRVAAVLLAHLLDQGAIGAQVGTAQSPVTFAMAIEMALQVDRLVRAVKRAQAQVHDTDLRCSPGARYTFHNRHRLTPSVQGWPRAEAGCGFCSAALPVSATDSGFT
ncbi:hypothetical protein D3C84_762010 [compost metagenome]